MHPVWIQVPVYACLCVLDLLAATHAPNSGSFFRSCTSNGCARRDDGPIWAGRTGKLDGLRPGMAMPGFYRTLHDSPARALAKKRTKNVPMLVCKNETICNLIQNWCFWCPFWAFTPVWDGSARPRPGRRRSLACRIAFPHFLNGIVGIALLSMCMRPAGGGARPVDI